MDLMESKVNVKYNCLLYTFPTALICIYIYISWTYTTYLFKYFFVFAAYPVKNDASHTHKQQYTHF